MTVQSLKVVWLLASLLAFTTVMKAQSEVVNVHVPFAFVAGGKSLPAGDYRLDKGQGSGVLTIQGGSGNSAAFLTMVAEGRTQNDSAALVFERHGSELFLAAVRVSGEQIRVLLWPDSAPAHAALKSAALASPVIH
jgi:hypothetical protein